MKGSLSNHESSDSERWLKNANSRCFKLHFSYSISFNMSNVDEFFWTWFWRTVFNLRKRKRKLSSCVYVLHKTWNGGISTLHSRNNGKQMYKQSVMHARANLLFRQSNPFLFCCSRCRCRCRRRRRSSLKFQISGSILVSLFPLRLHWFSYFLIMKIGGARTR